MSVETGRVCYNCRHRIKSRDEKYNITVCRCEVHGWYLNYALIMSICCERWAKKKEGKE